MDSKLSDSQIISQISGRTRKVCKCIGTENHFLCVVTRSFPSVFIPVGILILQMQIAEGKRNPAISTGYIIRAGDTIVVWKNVAVFHEVRVDILIWCVFFNLYLLCKHAFDKVFTGIVSGAAEFLGMSQNKVEMESDPFNQQFKVITSDDELAFYILTPQFMEHIVAADEKVDGYTKIEFENSRVTLALNNGKNSFELTKTLWSKSRLDETRLRFRYELNSILSIVDEMLTKENLF